MSADPTYPLFPIAAFITVVLLLLTLSTNLARQSWNFGVTLLTASTCLQLFINGVDAVVWADNADIKAYIYCDIVTHLSLFTYISSPASSVLITRRLYKIASQQSIEFTSRRARIVDRAFELLLGIGLPTLVTGLLYYVVQSTRFTIIEGQGCYNGLDNSILSLLLVNSWSIVLPSISLFFYCPKIIYAFRSFGRDTNKFIGSNSSVSRFNYLRILVLGCVDIFLTFPLGIVITIISAEATDPQFYYGWTLTHLNWEPVAVPYVQVVEQGWVDLLTYYLYFWAQVVAGLIIFLLFGLTADARRMYWRWVYAVLKVFGWALPAVESADVGEIIFGRQTVNTGLEFRSRASIVTPLVSYEPVSVDAEQSFPVQSRAEPLVKDILDKTSDKSPGV